MHIQQNNIEIKIGNNLPHIITRIQFHIYGLVVSRTMHHAHGLNFECLVFDWFSVTKHGLTYTTLFHVHLKEHLYLFSSLRFLKNVNSIIENEMFQLKTIAQYKLNIMFSKLYHK